MGVIGQVLGFRINLQVEHSQGKGEQSIGRMELA
jgi:hypothetical protein